MTEMLWFRRRPRSRAPFTFVARQDEQPFAVVAVTMALMLGLSVRMINNYD